MRALLSGISLPSWLPATRGWSRLEAMAICWLSWTSSPVPSPSGPAGPSGGGRLAVLAAGRQGLVAARSDGDLLAVLDIVAVAVAIRAGRAIGAQQTGG